jgi:hypothetical protein
MRDDFMAMNCRGSIIKLEYRKKFREDFTGNYIEILYDKEQNQFERIYFYDSEHGTLEYQNGIKKIHRWENEDEAQSGSYLNRRYTSVLLDGIADDPNVENEIIKSSYNFIKTINLGEDETKILTNVFDMMKNNCSPSMTNN